MSTEKPYDPGVLPDRTRHEIEAQIRRGVAAGELGKDTSFEAGGELYGIVGFDPMGAHGRLVYLENLRTGSRHSLVFPELPA